MTIWALIPLITCLTYIVLFALTLPSLERRINKVFAFYLGVAATWSFTSFMLHLNVFPQQALLWNELLVVALFWTLITYYHFIRTYVSKSGGKGVYLGYVLLLVLAVLALSGYIVQYSYVVDGVLYHDLGISIYIITAVGIIYFGAGLYLLIKEYRSSTDPIERNRTMYLIAGWSIIVLLSATNAIMIPSVAGIPLDHIGSLVNILIIAYAILRHQLLSIRFAVRRGLAYFLLVTCLSGIYSGAILLGIRLFPKQSLYIVLLFAAGLVLLLALLAHPIRFGIQRWVDRLFDGETYDYRQMLLGFNSKMGNIIDINQLADAILPAIRKALRITQVKLLFEDTNIGEFTTHFTYPETEDKSNNEPRFNIDSPIVIWLRNETSPLYLNHIDSIPQLKGLWQAEKEKLVNSKLELLYPIKSRDKLIGILALGKKQSDNLYSHEDIELIISIAGQAGVLIENARLYSQAVAWAHTDGLTKLYNHRYFHERLNEEIARGSRFGTMFSLIMLDIDLFKTYNDTYGHLAGDEILENMGRFIQASLRSIDMAFRYGGEEFAVILPETRLDDAYKVAERIRKTIEVRTRSERGPITVSLGIASWPIDGMAKEEVIARADAALYRAKETGRNRTCLSSEITKSEILLPSVEHEIKSRSLSIVYALAATVDAKDHHTYGHSRKVSQYAVAISEVLGLPQERIAAIRTAGLLHDIGKISIPDSILNKTASLSQEEWEPVKAHPELGVEILRHVVDLASCLPAILHHHEHYDGNGYPSGLKGENIPIEGRILAIADAYDAMTSLRPYREQLSSQQALDELKRCSGTQFDPDLVHAFYSAIQQV